MSHCSAHYSAENTSELFLSVVVLSCPPTCFHPLFLPNFYSYLPPLSCSPSVLSLPQHSPPLLSPLPFICPPLPSSLNLLLPSIHLYFLLTDCVQDVKGRVCQTARLEADFPKEECWTVLMANLTIIHHQQFNLYHIVTLHHVIQIPRISSPPLYLISFVLYYMHSVIFCNDIEVQLYNCIVSLDMHMHAMYIYIYIRIINFIYALFMLQGFV